MMRLFARPRAGIFRRGALTAVAFLTACSGGGGGAMPTPDRPAPSNPASNASVTFTMRWTPAVASASARKPAYVPASARSVSVAVNGGIPQVLNFPATALTIDAPVGTDTFAFATFDAQNAQGSVLSRATITKAVVAGAANVVSAVLNGVVASIALSLANPSPNAGAPTTIALNLAARDADGNTIVGAGDYATPIKLAIFDPSNSGTLALSTTVVPNAATSATLTYSGGTLASGLPGAPLAGVVASATGVASTTATIAPTPTFFQYALPTAGERPQWIAAGSDGNMWFTENGTADRIAYITPAGVVTECAAALAANARPQGIIGASDGNLWFTEFGANNIGHITTGCVLTEMSIPFFGNNGPQLLVDRGDGNIWYTANTGNYIDSQGFGGGSTSQGLPNANSGPYGITTAPDDALYFTESGGDRIGRLPRFGATISEVALTSGALPRQIVRGPDGNVWFTEAGVDRVARLSPASFTVTGEFPTLTPSSGPFGIAVGNDKALWFTEPGTLFSQLDKIGRVTTDGVMSEFTSPVSGLGLSGIAVGPDGSLWFAETGRNANPGRIGRLVY